MPSFDLTYFQKQALDAVILKWSSSHSRPDKLKPFKIDENPVRDLILDWLNTHIHCDAWMNESQGTYDKKIRGFRANNHRHHRKGVPDILGTWKGRALYIEVKRPATKQNGAGRPSEDQIAFIRKQIRHGAIAFFAWGLEDVREQLAFFERGLGI